MIDFILQFKWLFLILGEVVFWVSLLGFFVLRYALGREKESKYFILAWLLSDVWLLVLGFLDYRRTGEIGTFQIVIVIVLLYALTFGRSDMKKLDRWVKRQIRKWKGEAPEEGEGQERLTGMRYAVSQGREFAMHLAMYAAVILILSFFLPFRGFDGLISSGGFGDTLGHLIEEGLFADPVAGKITGIWTLILIIDLAITLSYFILPRKA